MNKNSPISGVIITYNEARNIERCIQSIQDVVAEVIVVDSFSEDDTVALAQKMGAKVIQQEFLGHIEQKNFAKNQADNKWVLSLDADEALSEKLKNSILNIFPKLSTKHAYSFNRKTNYCGYWVKHCGWYPDVKVRLFPKNKGNWGGKNPHDKFIIDQDASVFHLKGDLLHYSFYTQKQHLQQIEKFSTLGAQAYFEKGKKATFLHLLFSPMVKFIKTYIIKLGFLDGKAGLKICAFSAYATFLKYKKLQQLHQKQNA